MDKNATLQFQARQCSHGIDDPQIVQKNADRSLGVANGVRHGIHPRVSAASDARSCPHGRNGSHRSFRLRFGQCHPMRDGIAMLIEKIDQPRQAMEIGCELFAHPRVTRLR